MTRKRAYNIWISKGRNITQEASHTSLIASRKNKNNRVLAFFCPSICISNIISFMKVKWLQKEVKTIRQPIALLSSLRSGWSEGIWAEHWEKISLPATPGFCVAVYCRYRRCVTNGKVNFDNHWKLFFKTNYPNRTNFKNYLIDGYCIDTTARLHIFVTYFRE